MGAQAIEGRAVVGAVGLSVTVVYMHCHRRLKHNFKNN